MDIELSGNSADGWLSLVKILRGTRRGKRAATDGDDQEQWHALSAQYGAW